MLICPVCQESFVFNEHSARCANGHVFDISREGYVNLLRSTRPGETIGDDKISARCRRDFLNKGYYRVLQEALCRLFSDKSGNVLDICCGEGYYTSALGENENLHVFGFDISKEMVRLAARRSNGRYFVANMNAIPIADGTMDYATHLFAPFHEASFSRILKPGGRLYTVIPGKRHLFGLKQVLYDTPYENDEQLPQTNFLRPVSVTKVSDEITLASQEDIQAVFRMTPYYFHTSPADKEKLLGITSLSTRVEFVIAEYEKTPLSD